MKSRKFKLTQTRLKEIKVKMKKERPLNLISRLQKEGSHKRMVMKTHTKLRTRTTFYSMNSKCNSMKLAILKKKALNKHPQSGLTTKSTTMRVIRLRTYKVIRWQFPSPPREQVYKAWKVFRILRIRSSQSLPVIRIIVQWENQRKWFRMPK